jgi:hypothetical protein
VPRAASAERQSHGVQVVAVGQQQVVQFRHEHRFHKPGARRYGFLFEDHGFQLKLDVVGLVESPVVVLICL